MKVTTYKFNKWYFTCHQRNKISFQKLQSFEKQTLRIKLIKICLIYTLSTISYLRSFMNYILKSSNFFKNFTWIFCILRLIHYSVKFLKKMSQASLNFLIRTEDNFMNFWKSQSSFCSRSWMRFSCSTLIFWYFTRLPQTQDTQKTQYILKLIEFSRWLKLNKYFFKSQENFLISKSLR